MSETSKLTLGERIKKDLKERGLKATVIAKKMNVSRQSINQIDLRKRFDIEFLQKFKEASGLDYTKYAFDEIVDQLLTDQELNYSSRANNVTLTLNVSCARDQVDGFSNFLKDIEKVADKYGYRII